MRATKSQLEHRARIHAQAIAAGSDVPEMRSEHEVGRHLVCKAATTTANDGGCHVTRPQASGDLARAADPARELHPLLDGVLRGAMAAQIVTAEAVRAANEPINAGETSPPEGVR